MDMESILAHMIAKQKAETNRYSTLRTEYFVLSTLVQAMREEIIRMEVEKN